jgi:hypothetical protein
MRQSDPVVMSVHFPDANEAELVRKAAKRLGLSPSAFLRSVALEKASAVADGWDIGKMKKRLIDLTGVAKRARPTLKVIDGGKK